MVDVFNLWEMIGVLLLGALVGYGHGYWRAWEEIGERLSRGDENVDR